MDKSFLVISNDMWIFTYLSLLSFLVFFVYSTFVTWFRKYFANETQFNRDLVKSVRNNDGTFLCESTDGFKYTLIIHIFDKTLSESSRSIRYIVNRFREVVDVDDDEFELICVIYKDKLFKKNIESLSICHKNLRLINGANKEFAVYSLIVSRARGFIIFDTRFIDLLDKVPKGNDQFAMFAQPDFVSHVPYYDPLLHSNIVCFTKSLGVIVFTRIHLRNSNLFRYEFHFICTLLDFNTYIYKHKVPTKEEDISIFSSIYYYFVKIFIKYMYETRRWGFDNAPQ